MLRSALIVCGLVVAISCFSNPVHSSRKQSKTSLAESTVEVIDLTHSFDRDTIYWPTASGFRLMKDFVGLTEKGYFYSAYSFAAAEHGGTHLDAPRPIR